MQKICNIGKTGNEQNVLFNDALNTFFCFVGVNHMVKYHSDSKRGNILLIVHGLLFLSSSNASFYHPSHKGCGMCYPVCGMVHIIEPLLVIGKSSLCGITGIPLSLSEWSFTICLTPYNHK